MSIAAHADDFQTETVVQRTVAEGRPGELAEDIMQHLYTRQHRGKVVIITQEPAVLLAMSRKYWLKQVRQVQRARARTLNASQIGALSRILIYMEQLKFVSRTPVDQPEADVFFVRPTELNDLPTCHTIYVACVVNSLQLYELQKKLLENGLLVTYEV